MLVGEDEPIVSIGERFRISRTAVNTRLAVLSDAPLVTHVGELGAKARYRAQREPLIEVGEWLSHYEQFCDKKLSALKGYLEHKDRPSLLGIRGPSRPSDEVS